jgi:hypothetical protein
MTQEDTVQTRELWVSDKFSFMPAVTPTAAQTGWAVINKSTDRDIDCNNNDPLVNGDVLGTLIDDLIAKGILSA